MSTYPPPGRPAPPPPRPRGPVARVVPARVPPWGWLEYFLLAQMLIPGLLFVPGASFLRLATRVAVFAIALVAWAWVWRGGRQGPGSKSFPAIPWLAACSVWVGVSIFHPNTNSLPSGIAQAAMYLTVLSPAFWAPSALISARQVPRLLMIVFACNFLSALVGIGQVWRPATFNPPVIPAMENGSEISRGSNSYVAADGRVIVRPCGLSDNPGAAAGAGAMACLLGLCLAVRPGPTWRRMVGLGAAFTGMAAIYFCQMRTAMVLAFLCITVLGALFAIRGNYRQATMLGIGSVATMFVAAIYAVSTVGTTATARMMTLLEDRPDQVYLRNRGGFLQDVFENLVWKYPLGAGLGKWGQAYGYFGDHSYAYESPNGQIWVEIQWPAWVVDGGIPLMIGYATAVALAMLDTLRIALNCRDKELASWAAVICTINISIAALCFSSSPFVAPVGITFWLMAAVLHAADRQARRDAAPRRPAAAVRRFA